jgi:hypothetical protein
METTHSKTRRTKGSSPKIVVPSWDKVWESFKEDHTKTTIEAMNAEGWKTVSQVAEETCLSISRIRGMISENKVESIKKKVDSNGIKREINFIRPKTTTCQ